MGLCNYWENATNCLIFSLCFAMKIVLGDRQSTADGYLTVTVYLHESPHLSQLWSHSGYVRIRWTVPSPSTLGVFPTCSACLRTDPRPSVPCTSAPSGIRSTSRWSPSRTPRSRRTPWAMGRDLLHHPHPRQNHRAVMGDQNLVRTSRWASACYRGQIFVVVTS